jgi:hypothetical protein
MARPLRIERAGGWYHLIAGAMNTGRYSATSGANRSDRLRQRIATRGLPASRALDIGRRLARTLAPP